MPRPDRSRAALLDAAATLLGGAGGAGTDGGTNGATGTYGNGGVGGAGGNAGHPTTAGGQT
ncbi:hypothetical protein, partial [Mycobacterium gordonae]|uniref:hypothetical protein n=1 Tax=Mycobacterium gordonae TaxID=1778 RepID=UPI0018D316F6